MNARMTSTNWRRRPQARGGFTLVEVLVALAVMMLLLTIILVPVNLALDIFHIGKARNEVQQANRLVMNQMISDLKQAVFVYPNEAMPGITDKPPYSTDGTVKAPYYDSASTATRYSNLSRLDLLLPATNNGNVITPLRATNYVVSYYARRYDTSKAFDAYANPVVLFRAQYPITSDNGATAYSDTSNTRYSAVRTWLTQSSDAEPDLSSLCSYPPLSISLVTAASHSLITPRDMALVAPNAAATTPNYQPDTTFTCDDTDSDGEIDRVTVDIHQAKYDSLGASTKSQQLRSTQVVDLPNVK